MPKTDYTGSLGEETLWQLERNVRVDNEYTCHRAPCAHATRVKVFKRVLMAGIHLTHWTVPYVVGVKTQGGFDWTGVCAECVAEALAHAKD